MEYIKIKAIEESDFDAVVVSVGGSRIDADDSADYVFREAIIELKLIKEEGFEKQERQQKLAGLFRGSQPGSPIVSINPKRLNDAELREYYRIVEVPIKTACKKASKQLQKTAARFTPQPVRVLVILNVGYTLLSEDEFKDICFNRVIRDTSGIDWFFCGGIYFYSDKMDHYVLAPFEDIPINVACSFPSRDLLVEAWGTFLDRIMTDAIRKPETIEISRMPVVDMSFEMDGIRYVKTAPSMPQSNFWPGGVAPRENTMEDRPLPCVARVFPSLSENEWRFFKEEMPSEQRLMDTFGEWRNSYPPETPESSPLFCPLVHFAITYKEFETWIDRPKMGWSFSDIAAFATDSFNKKGLSILENSKEMKQMLIVPIEYLHLVIDEIGTDEANDMMAIYHISEMIGFEKREVILEKKNLFFKHGMALAAAYAVKRGVDALFYTKRKVH